MCAHPKPAGVPHPEFGEAALHLRRGGEGPAVPEVLLLCSLDPEGHLGQGACLWRAGRQPEGKGLPGLGGGRVLKVRAAPMGACTEGAVSAKNVSPEATQPPFVVSGSQALSPPPPAATRTLF